MRDWGNEMKSKGVENNQSEKQANGINVIWKQPVTLNEIREPLIDGVKFLNPQYITILRAPSGVGKTMALLYQGLNGEMPYFDENGIMKKNGKPVTGKYKVFVHECATDQMPSDLIGSYILRGGDTDFVASSITSAFKAASEGERVMLIFDEINLLRQEVLKSINSVMDDRKYIDSPMGRFSAGDNLILAGTMNSEYDSAGYDLDPQLRSRAIIPRFDLEKYVTEHKKMFDTFAKLITKTEGAFSIREIEKQWLFVSVFGMNQQDALYEILNTYPEELGKKIKENMLLLGVLQAKDKE